MPELKGSRSQRIRVDGMKCLACADKVESALRTLSGVESVDVDVSEGTATVAGDVEAQDLIQALSYTDYQARPLRE
jgi:copper chaperone CopZ